MRPIEKIDMLIEQNGVSARALAKAIGVPEDRIYKWRQPGQGQPSSKDLIAIASYFRVPAEFMLNPELIEIPAPSLSAAQLMGVKMIGSLSLSEDEVVRRLSHPGVVLAPTTPIAEHHGRDGTPPDLGIRPKRQDATRR